MGPCAGGPCGGGGVEPGAGMILRNRDKVQLPGSRFCARVAKGYTGVVTGAGTSYWMKDARPESSVVWVDPSAEKAKLIFRVKMMSAIRAVPLSETVSPGSF